MWSFDSTPWTYPLCNLFIICPFIIKFISSFSLPLPLNYLHHERVQEEWTPISGAACDTWRYSLSSNKAHSFYLSLSCLLNAFRIAIYLLRILAFHLVKGRRVCVFSLCVCMGEVCQHLCELFGIDLGGGRSSAINVTKWFDKKAISTDR